MKSLKIIYAFLIVLFGSSKVFAQTCPNSENKEITQYLDGNKAKYFNHLYARPPGCHCSFSIRAKSTHSMEEVDFDLSSEPHINGYLPKTRNYIREIVENKSRCPNENEYQITLKQIFHEELAGYRRKNEEGAKLQAQREENERLQIEAAKSARNTEMQKFCKGVPKVNQEIIEKISIVARIDPQSVRLNRVSATEDGYCIAIFYTSIGIAKTLVGFNTNGIIVSHEQIIFPK